MMSPHLNGKGARLLRSPPAGCWVVPRPPAVIILW
jgi:hypothetical protein